MIAILILFGFSGSHSISEAKAIGLKTASEVFADRTYQDDGTLTPRSQPNALIEDTDKAVQQVLQMIKEGTVTTVSGKTIPIIAETICIHGDGKHAVEFAKAIYEALKNDYANVNEKFRITLQGLGDEKNSAILGAAFLMATSAIGPGFLNNTSAFTQQLLTSFGFVILISILIDIGAQLNIWRIITVSENRAQDLSNKLFPGLGLFLAALVAFGGLAFNVGNIAGCGLGLKC